MTLGLEACTEAVRRRHLSSEPLGGAAEDRLARLPEVVDELRQCRRRGRTRSGASVLGRRRLRRTGVLGLRVPARYGGPEAACVTC